MSQNTKKKFFVSVSVLLMCGILVISTLMSRKAAAAHTPTSNESTLSEIAVATVPTVPTVPTVLTETPTATPTAKPTRDDDDDDDDEDEDEELDELKDSPLIGNYCLTTGGVGLITGGNGVFQVNVTGTPIRAYLYWGGRYPKSSDGDDTIQVAINGGLPISVKEDKERKSKLKDNTAYFTYQSVNLVNDMRFNGLLSGSVSVTASGLTTANVANNEGYGIGLLIVSEDPSCAPTQINLFYGLDSFFDNPTNAAVSAASIDEATGSDLGPNSDVVCVDFPAAGVERTLNIQAFVGGIDNTQPNALWSLTGSGGKPKALIKNNLGTVIDGPPATLDYPFTANVGPQFDNYTNSVVIPVGATFACYQIESDSSAVWISFASQLYASVITPTPTATATAPAIPTATSTAPAIPTATSTVPAIPTTTATVPAIPTTTATVPAIPTTTATVPAIPTTPAVAGFSMTILTSPLNPGPGNDIVYTANYTNSSAATIANLSINFTIPANTTFNSATSTPGWSCNGTTPGSLCTFPIGDVAPGAGGEVVFAVTVASSLTVAGTGPIVMTVWVEDGNQTIYHQVNIEVFLQETQTFIYLPLIR